MEELPEEVRSFLVLHPSLQPIPGNKVRFTPTGHELPCRLADLQTFTAGRKYRGLSGLPDCSEYGPHIVPSTKNRLQLFCKLTLRHINRRPAEIQQHVRGKRYQRALRKYDECQRLGLEYVPACIQNKSRQRRSDASHSDGRKEDLWKADDGQSEDSDSGDSMSDLYPAHMFSKKMEQSGEIQSPSEEEMEVESVSNGKRAQRQAGPGPKKFKSQHKRSRKFQKSARKRL